MMNQLVAGRYRLEHPLGRGGMATVWRARDEVLGRAVAVKLMAEGALHDASAVERFRHEANTVAGLGHANIVTVFDAGVDGHLSFLVMELIEGADLGSLIARGRLRVEYAVAVADQVCAALETAHRAGVVHRDLKPANLLMSPDGTVKVVDFGIARTAATARAGLTAVATVVGTSAYMAPEQATGAPVDARADLYALGCILHEMLTGKPPFAGENPMAVLYQHLHQPPRPLRGIRPDVPADLEQLVLDLLAKDPSDRPADAGAVRERLAGAGSSPALTTLSVPASPEAGANGIRPEAGGRRGRATARPDRRNRRGLVLLGAAVFAAAAITGYLVNSSGSPDASQAADPAPSATSSAPATAAPSQTASSPSTAATATRHQGTVADVQRVVTTEQVSGGLARDAAQDLHNRLKEIAKQRAKGRTDDADRKIEDLRVRLNDLQRAGKLTAAGATRITAALDALG
ncbi:serine/threonine-protein kinase [Streptomyces sp. CA-106131]|uniref:serine/threonine-protein kinase n=1 Tax=Streptomyces sp. CA-106131 TaxID=3240045 RepID=UPI003D92A53A